MISAVSTAAAPLTVTAAQRGQLDIWSRSRILPHRQVLRAGMILIAADGVPNQVIAKRLGTSKPSVLKWRARFEAFGLEGLEEAEGRGPKPTYGRDFVEKVIATALRPPTAGSTHWSSRRLAQQLGTSHATVHRIMRDAGLQRHLTRTFKFSTDPQLEEKVRDVVGLYLNPPGNAIVLSVDEKTQIQALDRTQPLLPMRSDQVARHTHDYVRHGTTTLFAVLDLATGAVTGGCYEKHRAEEFLAFLQLLARTYPHRRLHVIVDNLSTHKAPEVEAWLPKHPRIRIHFTPTSSSWLNQVETWFSILSRRAIRRGAFPSVRALTQAIQRFIDAWNEDCKPFVWVKTADEILASRPRQRSPETVH
jgi:transposase